MKYSNIVLFDAYGTLFRIEDSKPEIRELLGELKDPFFKLWRAKLLEYSWLTSLMEEFHEFDIIVDKAIEYCCEVLELSYSAIKPVLIQIYAHPKLFEDVITTLKKLNDSNVCCCIISNGTLSTLDNGVIENGIQNQIKKIFSASSVRKFKVSPRLYSMPVEHFELSPSSFFFISSNSWDISGAHNFGFQTIWLNRLGHVFDKLGKEPNYEISSFPEIEDILLK